MCGRFASATPPERIAAYFGASVDVDTLGENYNVAPTNDIYAVVATPDTSDTPARSLQAFQWGLVPVWAKDRKVGQKMINARSETIAEKAAFKGVFRKHRCIIPMDGFYEWRAGDPDGPVGKSGKPLKQPFFIHRADGDPLAVAGLWSAWRPRSGDADADRAEPWLHTATVVTTSANATMAPVHDRMPVLLPKAMWDLWLDPTNHNIDVLSKLLVPAPEHVLTMHPVSTDVNNVRNKGAHLIDPV
ncbi:MAG TPA: SOS response-associated peptidase [Ilumatobacter sp.]|nr:SOS response-associated peptidase [Ilumatobacter sp.]